MCPKFWAHSQTAKKSGASQQERRNVESTAQFHKNYAMEILHGQKRRNYGQQRRNDGQKRRIPAPKSKMVPVSQRTAHARNSSGIEIKHRFARPASNFLESAKSTPAPNRQQYPTVIMSGDTKLGNKMLKTNGNKQNVNTNGHEKVMTAAVCDHGS